MNATFTKNQMAYLAPAGLVYRDTDMGPVGGREPVSGFADRASDRGLGRKIADTLAWIAAWPRRHAELQELSMLTERELADIGIARSDIKRVFDPAFARDHGARKACYRSLGINV